MKKINFDKKSVENFYWLNEPHEHYFDDGLIIKTEPNTDFWQRTHYGFKNDNGHCYLTTLEEDFSFTTHLEFEPQTMYDQCGLFIRIDKNNWIKISTEYEDENESKLGSVVTNLGYSDWATTDISSDIKSMWYRVNKRGNDFLIENSRDGENWSQMRITHLHKEVEELEVGIYACSPKDGSFKCKVNEIIISKNQWKREE